MTTPEPADAYGELVRETWVEWATEQPGPKPSWLVPWAELDEGQREADRRIGAAVAAAERERIRQLATEVGAFYGAPAGRGHPR